MDPTAQLFEAEAPDLQRGLYADIRETFRAPIVNSIWRTLSAHDPALTRYVWGQLKPAFETREFAAFSITFRDRVLAAAEPDIPRYDPAGLDLDPAAFTELRGQAATFDAVAPRLAVLFALLDRRLNDRPVGTEAGGEAATAPFPSWLDRDRGRQPTMLPQDQARDALPPEIAAGFGEMVPSVYRCFAQWPAYLDRAVADLEPILDSAALSTARTEAVDLVETYLDRLPYSPRVGPEGLAGVGVEEETVTELRDFIGTFRAGGEELMPLLHIYAATLGAEGERDALSFPSG
jgi:hypothetical protein